MRNLSLLFLVLIFSCKKKKDAIPILEIQNKEIANWEEQIVLKGDTSAYDKLSLYYTFKLTPWPLLYYSQIMCNKFNYGFACFDCFIINSETSNPLNLRSNDSITNKFGIYYLLRAHELQYPEAKVELIKIFKNNRIPKSTNYLREQLQH